MIVVRDTGYAGDASAPQWWIAISHTHPGLARIFRDTDWSGLHGAPGAWAQMLGRFEGANGRNARGNPLKLRFDAGPQYCTMLRWETAFPPESADDDDAEFDGNYIFDSRGKDLA